MTNMFFRNAVRGKNDWWRYILGILAVILGYIIGQLPLMFSLWRSVDQNENLGYNDIIEFESNPDFGIFGINSNMGFLLLLAMFVFAFLALFAAFRPLHGRKFRSLISWKERINWKKIVFSFLLWLTLALIFEFISYLLNSTHYTFHFRWQVFVPLLLISLLILPIQTSLEEIVFRGYLMQGIGIWTKTRWIPLIVTSILFGLIHSMNPEIQQFGMMQMQLYYVLAGLMLGVITLMDDGLELALGVHAATNFVGAVFVGYEGAAIQTDSLFKVTDLDAPMMTLGFFICAIIYILIVKKVYKWGPFSKIFEPLDLQTPIQV